jgi:hypothetical protein
MRTHVRPQSAVKRALPPPPLARLAASSRAMTDSRVAQHDDGWGEVKIACPAGEVVAEVLFASWGDWTATCDGGIKCTATAGEDCHGAGCNGGSSCACPCKGFVSTDVCSSCSWSKGSCSGASAQDFVESKCLGKASCGPFPANNGNDYDGKDKGDPCPGKQKHLGVAVRCCPASGCPVLSEWGPQFLLFAFLACGAYFGGGGAYRFHKLGVRGPDLLPHSAFWTELRGLVEDGVAYSRSRGRKKQGRGGGGGGDGAGKAPLLPTESDGSGKEKRRKEDGSGKEKKRKSDKSDKPDRAGKGGKGGKGGKSGKADKADKAERGEGGGSPPAPAPAPASAPAPAAAAGTASAGGGAQKRLLKTIVMLQRSICQDRLWTNIAEAEIKRAFCARRTLGAHSKLTRRGHHRGSLCSRWY